jgi:hypothetical protein
MKTSDRKILFKLLKIVLLSLLIAVLAECFLFNYRFWESRGFSPEKVDLSQISASGLKLNDDGTATVTRNQDSSTDEEVSIQIPIETVKVKNFYLNPFADNAAANAAISLVPSTLDSTGTDHVNLSRTEVVNGITESRYLRLHLNYGSKILQITFPDLASGDVINLSDMVINARRPFLFHPFRLLFLMILGILIGIFRPKSFIYQKELSLQSRKQKIAVLLWMIFCMIGALMIGLVFFHHEEIPTEMQYDYVARALAKGHVWLDFKPDKVLSEISNPYNTAARVTALQKSGETAIMDFAYYHGKYYSYFGVLPAVLFFLPYYLITGKDLATGAVIIGLCLVFIVAAFWFIYTLIKKYFQHMSLGLYLLLTTAFLAGSQIIYALQMPTLYSLPLIFGLLLDMVGITCWLKASDKNLIIRKRWLIAGSVCLALVLGCRPQLMLAVFLAFPIFWKEIRERLFFSKKGLLNTLCVILPFFPICSAFLLYNKARFGSLLDFGATYNLTAFDMTHRGIVPDRFWLGFYEYFFQPLTLGSTFPYLRIIAAPMQLVSDFQGQVINEPLMAGFFAINPIAVFLFCIPRYRKSMKQNKVLSFSLVSLLLGILITAVDIQMVGMTLRYQMDFGMLLTIPLVLVLGSIYDYKLKAGEESVNVFLRMVFLLTVLSVLINCWGLVADGRFYDLAYSSPRLYYRLKYLLCGFLSIR